MSRMRSLGLAVAAPLGAMALAFSPGVLPMPNVSAPSELLAQALYMRGTKIGGYIDDDGPIVAFGNAVIRNTVGPGQPQLQVDNGDDPNEGGQVEYNGGFWPVSHGGLNDLTYGASVRQGLSHLGTRVDSERNAAADEAIVLYGYSQGAVVIGQYKAQTAHGNIIYVLLSNPGRPNGGILARFQGLTIPILDIPMSGPTPTESAEWDGEMPTTYDITRQYDGWADFPRYPLNLLATANALLGILYLHGSYEFEVDPDAALAEGAENTDVRSRGDSVYYTIGTDLLPLLRPLAQVGVPRPLLLMLDAPLRTLIEQGYDRTANPGTPMAAGIIRIANPITDIVNFLQAIPVGIDDGLEAGGFGRPLNTRSAGMYGVGGPEVTPSGGDTLLDEDSTPAPDNQRIDPPLATAHAPEPDTASAPEAESAQEGDAITADRKVRGSGTADRPARTVVDRTDESDDDRPVRKAVTNARSTKKDADSKRADNENRSRGSNSAGGSGVAA